MKALLKTIFIIFASLHITGQSSIDKSLDKYLLISSAMSKKDFSSAKAQMIEFHQLINSIDEIHYKNDFNMLIDKYLRTKNPEVHYAIFSKISRLFWDAFSDFKQPDRKLYFNYCVMKNVYWIDNFKEIRNPYHCKVMLRCGITKDNT